MLTTNPVPKPSPLRRVPVRLAKSAQSLLLSRHWLTVVVVAALTAFVLGTIGFRQTIPSDTIADAAYKSLQLFSMNSGAVPDPSLNLQLARFLAPAVVAVGVLSALRRLCFRYIVSFFVRCLYRRHIIVCGLGRKGLAIARSAARAGEQVVVLEKNQRAPEIAALRRSGVAVLVADATDERNLRAAGIRRAAILYSVTNDELANDAIVCAAASARRELAPKTRLHCLAHTIAPMPMKLALDAGAPENMDRSWFNATDRIAWSLIQHTDPFRNLNPDGSNIPHLLVAGRGELPRYVLRYLAMEWERLHRDLGDAARPLRLVLVHPRARRELDWLRANHRGIEAVCTLVEYKAPDNLHELNHAELGENVLRLAGPLTQLIVCAEHDDNPLHFAWAFAHAQPGGQTRVFAALADRRQAELLTGLFDEPLFFNGLDRSRIELFLCDDEALNHHALEKAVSDPIARLIHDTYLRATRASRSAAPARPSEAPWPLLPEAFRESSRDHARDIPRKLARIGCRLRRATPRDDAKPFAFTPDEIEQLAIDEHQRWMHERRRAGWNYAPRRSDIAKLHPDMVAWEALPEDRRQIDRDLIIALPEILRHAGYQIERQPPGS